MGGSYINYPDRIKREKTTTNPVNEDYKCLQYVATVVLIHEEIKIDPQKVS